MCDVPASVEDILAWARIERVGRDGDGTLRGFKRPQIASHIRDVRDYLAHDDAVLPNPIVVAFVGGVKIVSANDGLATVSIRPEVSGLGLVVDEQQRLVTLSKLPDKKGSGWRVLARVQRSSGTASAVGLDQQYASAAEGADPRTAS